MTGKVHSQGWGLPTRGSGGGYGWKEMSDCARLKRSKRRGNGDLKQAADGRSFG